MSIYADVRFWPLADMAEGAAHVRLRWECRQPYQGKRVDQAYCSHACKMRAYRRRKAAHDLANQTQDKLRS